MNYLMPPVIEMARPGDGIGICRVLAEAQLATFPNAEHVITEEMVRRIQYQPDGGLREDYIEQTETGLARNGDGLWVYVARTMERIVAVGSLKILDDQRRKLKALYVEPNSQGQGIGSRILDLLLAEQPDYDVHLKVAAFNERAIGLYISRGFEIVGPAEESDRTIYYDGTVLPEYMMLRQTPQPADG